MNPLVSVIVPTYNGEAFVRETLDSVLSQDYRPIEVVVCDDGSTDGTLALLATYGDRIKVVRQANRGVAAARNRAARESRGEILAFLDHDDVWEPRMLSTLVPLLVSRPELGLVYSDAFIIDARGALHGLRGRYLAYAEGWVFEKLLRGNFIPVETTLVRAELFHELGGCDESLRYLEDYELCLRLARRAPVGFHPRPLARYRIHERNLSHEIEPMLVEWYHLIQALRAESGLTQAQLDVLDFEAAKLCVDLAWRALRRKDVVLCDEWFARANGLGPRRARLQVHVLRMILVHLPARVGRMVLKRLPRRRLYGVEIPVATKVTSAPSPAPKPEPAVPPHRAAR